MRSIERSEKYTYCAAVKSNAQKCSDLLKRY